jgi:quinol monooxygenase YgiN
MRVDFVEFRAFAGSERAVAELLQALAIRSKVFDDYCLDFQIANDLETREIFYAIMTYVAADAQATHCATDHFEWFLKECAPMLQSAPDGTKIFNRKLLSRIALVECLVGETP